MFAQIVSRLHDDRFVAVGCRLLTGKLVVDMEDGTAQWKGQWVNRVDVTVRCFAIPDLTGDSQDKGSFALWRDIQSADAISGVYQGRFSIPVGAAAASTSTDRAPSSDQTEVWVPGSDATEVCCNNGRSMYGSTAV